MHEVISRRAYPNRDEWCALVLSVKKVTVHVVSWKCPDCGMVNETRLVPGQRRANPFRVKARCGRCHGRGRTLLTRGGRAIKP